MRTRFKTQSDAQKTRLKNIFHTTINALENGSYTVEDAGKVDIKDTVAKCVKDTILYDADSVLSKWSAEYANGQVPSSTKSGERQCEVIIRNMTTLAGARLVEEMGPLDGSREAAGTAVPKIGTLNFADAKKPGGLVVEGAATQEESIARSSTLYLSLTSEIATPYYALHKKSSQGGFYTHTMIYSPDTLLLRDDDGTWLPPLSVDVVSSPAVNARAVARTQRLTREERATKVESVMYERAARLLYAFSMHGVRQVVLGAWGCGIFGNDVRKVAVMWANLLGREDSRYRGSFDRVVFAVLGQDPFDKFKEAFEERCGEA